MRSREDCILPNDHAPADVFPVSVRRPEPYGDHPGVLTDHGVVKAGGHLRGDGRLVVGSQAKAAEVVVAEDDFRKKGESGAFLNGL